MCAVGAHVRSGAFYIYIFTFILTSIVLREQNPPGPLGNPAGQWNETVKRFLAAA
jgi:hypothetical protein